MTTILDKIVATKRVEVVEAKQRVPLRELETLVSSAPRVRDFAGALAAPGPIKLIAEVKKASPSRGVIRADFDPVSIARVYEQHGATCVSVLTDESYFQGRLRYLSEIRHAIGLPVLRKDFIIDSYQVWEARAAGADAVLLIAECLDDKRLRRLLTDVESLGMAALVELYEPENVSRVVDSGARLVGVNNRNLRTFEVDLNHTIELRKRIPESCTVVGESGIWTREDVRRLEKAGVAAILVGESLMRQDDIGAAVDALLGR